LTLIHFQSTWKWSQSNAANEVANVAFDIFTSTSAGGSDANEIMIWLANFNAGPISYNYNADGSAKAVATGVSLAGHTW
jgi:xyloglucan-specific endo-beta-1,4-glucanase